MLTNLPLILLPGLGADRRLFPAQTAALENLVTPAVNQFLRSRMQEICQA